MPYLLEPRLYRQDMAMTGNIIRLRARMVGSQIIGSVNGTNLTVDLWLSYMTLDVVKYD
jgi:hypothetical protein